MVMDEKGESRRRLVWKKVVRQVEVKLYEGGPVTGNPCSVNGTENPV